MRSGKVLWLDKYISMCIHTEFKDSFSLMNIWYNLRYIKASDAKLLHSLIINSNHCNRSQYLLVIIDLTWVDHLFLSCLQPNYNVISLMNHMKINDLDFYNLVNFKDKMVLI